MTPFAAAQEMTPCMAALGPNVWKWQLFFLAGGAGIDLASTWRNCRKRKPDQMRHRPLYSRHASGSNANDTLTGNIAGISPAMP